MAYVKRTKKDGTLLVGYRPFPGAPERFGTVANRRDFAKFKGIEEQHHLAGTLVPSPETLFQPLDTPAVPKSMTLGQWIGEPTKDRPGPFFNYARQMSRDRWGAYEQQMRYHVLPVLGGKYMSEIRRSDIVSFVTKLLACPACVGRAAAVGVELTDLELAVTSPPFDGNCVELDENGLEVSTHYPAIRRRTVQRILAMISGAFSAGMRSEDGICTTNPVSHYHVPRFVERPNNEDLTQALDHVQLQELADAHPPDVAAAPLVLAYGLLRRSELFGLNRGDIHWPDVDDKGVARLDIRRVCLYSSAERKWILRPWGKTPSSVRHVPLAQPAAEALRWHMEEFRSTPRPRVCQACAEGIREWEAGLNRHRGCDFADDAPVFVGPQGRRLMPNRYSTKIFAAAVERAGLTPDVLGFRLTPKVLRATGATLLLELGTPESVVEDMGGWTRGLTLKLHYKKGRDGPRHTAAVNLGQAAAADLGWELDVDAPVEVRLQAAERRAQEAEAELERVQSLLIKAGLELEEAPEEIAALRDDPKVRRWDEENVRAAIEASATRKEILRRLGTAGPAALRHLESIAAELDIALPPPWGREAWGEEKVRAAVDGARSRAEIYRRLGVRRSAWNIRKLEEAVERYGLTLPPLGGDRRRVFTEDELRAAIAGAPSRKEVFRRLGVQGSSPYVERVAEAAGEFGLQLPPVNKQHRDISDEEFRAAIDGAITLKQVFDRLDLSWNVRTQRRVAEAAARLGLPLPTVKISRDLWADDRLRAAFETSRSWREIFEQLGTRDYTAVRRRLKAIAEELGCTTPALPGPVKCSDENWTEEKVRPAFDGARSYAEIYRRLGVSESKTNTRRLLEAAQKWDLKLPTRYRGYSLAEQQQRRDISDEEFRSALTGAITLKHVLDRLDLSWNARNQTRITEAAARLGLALPIVKRVPSLWTEERIWTAFETSTSWKEIFEKLGTRDYSEARRQLKAIAEGLGCTTPDIPGSKKCTQEKWTEERIRAAFDGAGSYAEICRRLGVAQTEPNTRRLLDAAEKWDLPSPTRRRAPSWTEEQLRSAFAGARSTSEICQRIGVKQSGPHMKDLIGAAAELGLTFPKANQYGRELTEEELRAAIEGASSQKEILERLGMSRHRHSLKKIIDTAAKYGLFLPYFPTGDSRKAA